MTGGFDYIFEGLDLDDYKHAKEQLMAQKFYYKEEEMPKGKKKEEVVDVIEIADDLVKGTIDTTGDSSELNHASVAIAE